MKPDITDMIAFLAVVDARSFTAAADHLGRTKSAISQSIARLEENLNCRLLYRSTRSLSLTEAGTRFYAHCRGLKQAYDDALEDMQSSVDEPRGVLSVTAPHALCATVVAPALSGFLERHPRMRVRLIAEDAQIDLIGAQLDLALRVGQPKEQAAQISRLGTLEESLYAGPGYIAQQGIKPKTFAALASWDHIANDWQGDPLTYQGPDGSTLRVAPRVRCSAFPDILRLVEAGAGVALLPDIAAKPSVTKQALVRLFPVAASPVHSLHHFARKPPQKVQSFISFLRAALRHGSA